MPAQRPGTSEQAVRTPPEFLAAVERRFGKLTWDIAANAENSVAGENFFGPGSIYSEDALVANWPVTGHCWLNPPYGMIKGIGFARRCAVQAARGCAIVMLIPAAVATNWFADEVYGKALVIPIRPRLTFLGHKDPFPKDLMICAYNLGEPGFEPWDWRGDWRVA